MGFNKLQLLILVVLTVLSSLLVFHVAADTFEGDLYEAQEVKLQISHGFGHDFHEAAFKPRGTLTIKNFRGPRFTVDQEELSMEDISKMEALSNEDGYYYLALTIKSHSGDKTFRTFFPVKSLLEAGLSDEFRVHLNANGEIFSVSYHVRKPRAPKGGEFPIGHRQPPAQRFSTTLTVKQGEVGPVPDTGPYLEKLEMERLARERGDDGKDNRSFFAKYWMYIVPVGILVLLSSAQNPEGGGN